MDPELKKSDISWNYTLLFNHQFELHLLLAFDIPYMVHCMLDGKRKKIC